jgi:YD repeat-containing protein
MRSLDYDYTIGTPRGSTDASSLKKYTTFDGYGRAISEHVQSGSGTAVLVSTRSYQDTNYPRSVTMTTKTLGGDKVDRVYLDGLDRPIQLRRSGYAPGDWWVQDMAYDRSGNATALSYPYTSMSSIYDENESMADISRTYDTRGRMTSETDVNGMTSFVYEPRSTRSIDRGGATRTAHITARGTLAAITESMGSGSRSTSYSYTPLGQISRLTDALGNIRDYTYDGLQRVTRLEDLHTLSDTSPLSIRFAYDDASRMTRRTNQAGEYTQMTYDALGRTTKQELYTSSSNLSRTQNFAYDAGVHAL